ncbi:MAG: hypothetical protein Q9159_006222 [Coniocarpon cinnabarinum]
MATSTWPTKVGTFVLQRSSSTISGGGTLVTTGAKSCYRACYSKSTVVCALLLGALSFAWIVVEYGKPTGTPIKHTMQHPSDLILLLAMSLAAFVFASTHYTRLAKAHRRRLIPPTTHYGVLQPQDQYILRTMVCQLLGTATLIASHREDMTQHVALTWEPILLNGALILNAAYEGREFPIDIEMG